MANRTHIRFDWAMKRMLRNKANFEILEGFLSELLEFDVKIQEILESEGNKEHEQDKYNRVDILVKDSNNNHMLIEVQNEKEHDYFQRMLYGQAKLISERLTEGDTYSKLTRIYSINIVYFPLGAGKDYVYISNSDFIGIHYKDTLELTDTQKEFYNAEKVRELFTQYYIIKVNQFNDIAQNTLDEWIYFLKNNEIKDSFKAKGLEKAKQILRVDKLSKSDRIAYNNYVKYERVRMAEMETALFDLERSIRKEYEPLLEQKQQELEAEKHRAEVEKQKADEFKRKMILKLHKIGNTIEEISEDMQMSIAEIKNIIGEIK